MPQFSIFLFHRELLHTLTENEMSRLEKSLCSSEESEKPIQTCTDESSQTDQSLEGGIEPSTSHSLPPLDISLQELDDDVMESNSSPTSPITPVAPMQALTFHGNCSLVLSESHDTETNQDESHDETLTCHSVEVSHRNPSLNKSESRDSGLHSENVSTSEMISCEANSVISEDATCACIESISADKNHDSDDVEGFCPNCHKIVQCDENAVESMCSNIINHVVDDALDTCLNLTNAGRYSRQTSWQYNMNIEIPRNSELAQEDDHEIASSNSDSSTCTLSTSPNNCDKSTSDAPFSFKTQNQSGCTSSSNDEAASLSACDNVTDSSSRHGKHQKPSISTDKKSAAGTSSNDDDDDPLSIKPSTSNQKHKGVHNSKPERATQKNIDRIHCKTGSNLDSAGVGRGQDPTTSTQEPSTPRIQRLRYPESVSSSFSSCHSNNYDSEWDRER